MRQLYFFLIKYFVLRLGRRCLLKPHQPFQWGSTENNDPFFLFPPNLQTKTRNCARLRHGSHRVSMPEFLGDGLSRLPGWLGGRVPIATGDVSHRYTVRHHGNFFAGHFLWILPPFPLYKKGGDFSRPILCLSSTPRSVNSRESIRYPSQ